MTPVAGRRARVTPSANSTPDEPILLETDGDAVVLKVRARLDERAGAALVSAVSAALASSPARVSINLRDLTSWTESGARSLVRCREVCADLPGGLHYRTGRGPGREALLAAYA